MRWAPRPTQWARQVLALSGAIPAKSGLTHYPKGSQFRMTHDGATIVMRGSSGRRHRLCLQCPECKRDIPVGRVAQHIVVHGIGGGW